jgi:bifunctional enzyme CysN/CysC
MSAASPFLNVKPQAPPRPAPLVNRRMAVVITGHVDHGKSTIIGRLLADTRSLPEGKIEQIRAFCERTARPFEYAFILDALKDEQAQGITIDAARIFFESPLRRYVILDTPGHIEFLKNMITGAAHAEAALLVIDAMEGIRENSRRHGAMLSLLGVRQVAVLVNKMDLVDYEERVYDDIVRAYGEFLGQLDVTAACFIPVCGRSGENLALRSGTMPWYEGPTLLEMLDAFTTDGSATARPFRMPVQGVYKFTAGGDDRRIVAGNVLTGTISVGDEVVFYPSGKRTAVASLEAFNAPPPASVTAGGAGGFTLTEQLYVTRGELATRADQPRPRVTTRLRVSLFWLGRAPLVVDREYTLKLGTARVPVRVEAIHRVMDAATLEAGGSQEQVERHDVADCVLKLGRPVAFDLVSEIAETARFVIVDEYEIRGGGIVREAIDDNDSWVRDTVLLRNYNWEPSGITKEQRAGRFGQVARLILITGEQNTDRKAIARDLEARLFGEGRLVYFLGIGNLLYGVDADLGRAEENRREHMRRLSEIANLMLDTGAILIVTAAELMPADLETIQAGVDPDRITTVWLGEALRPGVTADLRLSDHLAPAEAVDQIMLLLTDLGVVFRPW